MANTNQNSNDTSGNGRGFASMDPDEQRKIASKGGKAAHRNGSAHEFNSEEAKRAGQKGGRARASRLNNDDADTM
jgi:general stress protein YciG